MKKLLSIIIDNCRKCHYIKEHYSIKMWFKMEEYKCSCSLDGRVLTYEGGIDPIQIPLECPLKNASQKDYENIRNFENKRYNIER